MAFNTACGSFILLTAVLSDLVAYEGSYRTFMIENDKICSRIVNPSYGINLGDNNKSGVIVRESDYFNRISSDRRLCHFKVTASFNLGIFAVIQKMNLRRDLDSKECLDYIQFRHLKKNPITDIIPVNLNIHKHSHDWGPQYCGTLNAFEAGTIEHPKYKGLSFNGFVDEEGRLEVFISISNKQTPPRANLSVEIAFTGFKKSSQDLGAYRLCGNETCIWKNYFNDGIVNCPYLNCVDEYGCNGDNDKTLIFPNFGSKVTITAVSSIFISFFLFLGCIWLCRYFEFFCWGLNNVHNSNNPVEMDPMHRATPTAPPTEQPLDKDLPPSYETLFPDRKNIKKTSTFYK